MKLSQRSILACICAGALAPALHCRGQCHTYAVDILTGPDCQFEPSDANATALNDAGELCGSYYTCNKQSDSAVWLGSGPWIPLATAPGTYGFGPKDINASRQMAGNTTLIKPVLVPLAAHYDFETHTMTVIGALPGHNLSEATAIAGDSTVVGYSNNDAVADQLRAVVWQDGELKALKLPYGVKAEAFDISSNGKICGWMGNHAQNDTHAYIYDLKSGEVIDVGTPLLGTTNARAIGINNADVICGWSSIPCGFACLERKSFIWNNGVVQELGVLPEYISAFAQAINDANVIVGYCDRVPIDAFTQAFVWQNGVMTALNDLVPAELNLNIREAWDINNAGQIVATAFQVGSFDRFAVRLTPIPSPTGDFDGDCTNDWSDILATVQHWHNPIGPGRMADYNADGDVNVLDLLILIQNWS